MSACSSPADRFRELASDYDFRTEVISGIKFTHAIFHKDGPKRNMVHVYLGGDGRPYIGAVPSRDPTPRFPLMLQLMAGDPSQSLYLGRPCYHTVNRVAACTMNVWTIGRYSRDVVSSMATALRYIIDRDGFNRIAFFGYSGGGALAMLIARLFSETVAVVTFSANLDTDAWADNLGYPRLAESLNPVLLGPLPGYVTQRHYVGSLDRVVPPKLTINAAEKLEAPVQIIDEYGHACCWHEIWPKVLTELSNDLRSSGRGPANH